MCMEDFGATAFACTPSYALYLGEAAKEAGVVDRLQLKVGINGAEPWTDEMRRKIEELLNVNSFDIYGLCEINREDIKKARLIANPGCYPTCSTLSIYPMAKEGLIEMNSVIIDAKSGTSGVDVEQKSTTYIVKSMKTSKHMESQHTDILQRLKIS